MDNKISIRKIWSVAQTEWLKWVCNSRMIIIPVLTAFIYSYAITPLLERSEKMGEPLNILEPLIAVGNSQMLTLVIPIVFLTLMSDFPRTDGSTVFMISRTGRKNWMIGQMLFGALSAVTFLAVIYVICTAFLTGKAFLANGWSMVAKRYNVVFPDERFAFASELLPENLYNQMTPFSAVIQTYLLLFLYLFMLILVMLLFRQRKLKAGGFLAVSGIIGFGGLFTSIKASFMWCFPMANTIVWLHYTEIFRKEVFPVSYSYIYFAVFIAVLVFANIIASGKMSIDSIDETEA